MFLGCEIPELLIGSKATSLPFHLAWHIVFLPLILIRAHFWKFKSQSECFRKSNNKNGLAHSGTDTYFVFQVRWEVGRG